jgi:hypothetical protein
LRRPVLASRGQQSAFRYECLLATAVIALEAAVGYLSAMGQISALSSSTLAAYRTPGAIHIPPHPSEALHVQWQTCPGFLTTATAAGLHRLRIIIAHVSMGRKPHLLLRSLSKEYVSTCLGIKANRSGGSICRLPVSCPRIRVLVRSSSRHLHCCGPHRPWHPGSTISCTIPRYIYGCKGAFLPLCAHDE